MTASKFEFGTDGVHRRLWKIIDLAEKMQADEQELIRLLYNADEYREYVKFGYKSLRGFCVKALRFSKTQSQRIATMVGKYDPYLIGENDLLVGEDSLPEHVEIDDLDEPYFSSAPIVFKDEIEH